MKKQWTGDRGQGAEVTDDIANLLKHQVDAWEIYYSSNSGLGIEVKDSEVDSFKVSSNTGIGLRIIKDKKIGLSFINIPSKDSLADLVNSAVLSSSGVESDEFLSIPIPLKNQTTKGLMLFDSSLSELSVEDKIQRVKVLEQSAKDFDPRVKKIRKAGYQESISTNRVVNSMGIDAINSATYISFSIMTVAEDNGDSQMGWEMGLSHFAKDVDETKIGRDAAKKAVSMLASKTIKNIRCPVVIENIIACEFLEIIAPSFYADNLSKGKSMLKGKKGNKVFSQNITLWDDGILPNGWGTSEFDGEGILGQKTCLIDKGIFIDSLYDTYWAKRDRVSSTGNAIRSNFKSVSSIGITNLYIKQGALNMDGLLKNMDKGFLITNILGAHTANPITGDFSLGASGFWIENGKPVYPVRGAAIAGNILDLFSKIDVVGNDMRFIGKVGAPSLLVHKMDISGTDLSSQVLSGE